MTRVVSVLVGALVVSTLGLVGASPASAVSSALTFQLSGGTTMPTPLGTDSTGPCVDDTTPGTYSYTVVRIKPTASGSYTITEDGPSADGRLGIYTGAFNPTAQLTNCLAFIDENNGSPFGVTLTGGTTYTLVRSAGVSGGSGDYAYTVAGPGTLTVLTSTTTTLTSNPNPSELSKATTLKAVVTGGTPTGTVQFKKGATVLGSAAVVSGVAKLNVKTLAVGTHTLSATYSGDATHDVSSDTHSHTVKYGPKPKVRLAVSDKQVVVGDRVRLAWVTKRADKVRASGAWSGKRAKRGTQTVRIRTLGVHIFKLRATNVNGATRARVKVVAVRPPKVFTVSLPDDVLTAGTDVRVKSAQFDAKERYKVFLDDDLLVKGFATRTGLVSVLASIPKATTEGPHTISVMGSNPTRLGEVDVQIVAPTKKLAVKVEKAKVKIGGTNIVYATGLVAGEEVTVTYEGAVLVEGVADSQGKFEYTFAVTGNPATQTVFVEGQVPGRAGDASFVAKPATAA